MSQSNEQQPIIRNTDTSLRRDWVERAIAAVRRRLEAGERLAGPAEADKAPRPDLHIVPASRKR